jgi:hypothetical protein
MKINSNDELDLMGSCLSKCDGLSITHTFYIYMLDSSSNNWIPFTNESYFYTSIESDMNLIVLKDLFKLHSHQLIWKIEYKTTVLSYANKNLTSKSSILFYVNRPPLNGTCDIKPKNGSTNDLFYITCEKWSDVEGSVTSYSYFGNKIRFLNFKKLNKGKINLLIS